MDYILAGIPLAFYMGVPLLIKFSQTANPNPQIVPVYPSQWSYDVAQYMNRVEHDLYALGFTITARFQMPNSMPNTHALVTMLVNYNSGDKAMITAIWGCTNGVWTLGTNYTEFSTRFEDGACFDTMNSSMLSSFQKGPQDVKTQVPQIREAAELWALHRFVMKKHSTIGKKVVYDISQAEAYLRRIWREGFEEQVKLGRFKFDGTVFRPSWKGAYLMTWGMLWPMSAIRKMRLATAATTLVREWKNTAPTPASPYDNTGVVIRPEVEWR